MTGPLSHIRVLDLSRILAGPFCTQILGDLGADVVKVERPGTGDDTRGWGPPYLTTDDGEETAESAYFLSANRNKRSVMIDIATQEGAKLIDGLLAQCDVLVENFRTGALARYGLDYASLSARHPHLIYCSITGFGQTGPMKDAPGYDFLVQGLGGLMAATGEKDAPPMKVGVALSDIMTGQYAAIGILSALVSRERTGKGQHIDLSLLDTTIANMGNIAQHVLTSGELPPRLGNAHASIVPYQVFATSDGHIILAVGNDTQFQRMCAAIGKEDWAADPRFATNSARVRNRDALLPQLSEICLRYNTEWWLQAMRLAGVPASPVNDMDQALSMEQVRARDMLIALPHKLTEDPIPLVGSPLKLSETPVSYRRAPPLGGQHSDEILEELLALPPELIEELRQKGIVA